MMTHSPADRIIASRASLIEGLPSPPVHKAAMEGGCGVVGLAASGIIGAIVLVAVAVLVVPVFLDGPVDESAVVSERINLPGQGGDDGVRTVVLDRDRSEPVPAAPMPASTPTRCISPPRRCVAHR